jgi:hypothetical protein
MDEEAFVAVVDVVMAAHPRELCIQAKACVVIGLMAELENQSLLRHSNIFPQLVCLVGRFGPSLQAVDTIRRILVEGGSGYHARNGGIAARNCAAANHTAMQQAGAVPELLRAMQGHPSAISFQQDCMYSLGCLARYVPQHILCARGDSVMFGCLRDYPYNLHMIHGAAYVLDLLEKSQGPEVVGFSEASGGLELVFAASRFRSGLCVRLIYNVVVRLPETLPRMVELGLVDIIKSTVTRMQDRQADNYCRDMRLRDDTDGITAALQLLVLLSSSATFRQLVCFICSFIQYYTHAHTRTHTHTHALTHTCTHTHTHARTHAHTHAHTHTHLHLHAYMNSYTHTH